MVDYLIQKMNNPLDDIKIDLGSDEPLWLYIKRAIQDIEVINLLSLNPIYDQGTVPFLYVTNWRWNPHPLSEKIQYRRRETGDKLSTKMIGNTRVGILEFDIYCGARDKNNKLVTEVVPNHIFIPIEDDQGRYQIENTLYPEYQLVDKFLYPSGRNSITLKSLLPIVISYKEATETSVSGYMVTSKIGMVKIFTTMEPILACFMHVAAPLCYLEVFPVLQFCDRIIDDTDEFEYFQPTDNEGIYIKGYRKGLEEFEYVRSILVMCISLIRKYNPPSVEEVRDPKWWVYQLSYHDNMIEHRGACHEMHVARMLDTISAQVLPIPQVDKRVMISLLRYVLQTDFDDVDIFSYDNKRLRHNEVISTIVTSNVSKKLKRMFPHGALISMKEMLPILKFDPQIILKNWYDLGTMHVADFVNDLDYYQYLRYTTDGQLVA